MRTHELKTWPEPYEAVVSGIKTFEVRLDDRGFAVGDTLQLKEWDPTPCVYTPRGYTGREALFRVTFILHGGRFGLPPGLVVMAIVPKESKP